MTRTSLWLHLLLLGCLLATVLVGCGLILVANDRAVEHPLYHHRSEILEVHQI